MGMKVWMPAIAAGSGADVYTSRLAVALGHAGHVATITWLRHALELRPGLHRANPPCGTDVIHANSWSAHAFVRHGLPTVATDHGFVGHPEFVAQKTWRQQLYHAAVIEPQVLLSLRTCDAVTAVSHELATAIQPLCPRRVEAIPNWVDTNRFKPLKRPNEGSALRVLYLGNASRRKGFDILQWLLRGPLPGIEVWCLEGLRPRLLDSRVPLRFFARLAEEDMPTLYAQCDVVLMPSRYEGFGYVALEALACSRPVVGFACAGLRETCDTQSAMLVPIDDRDALREHLLLLAGDRRNVERIGEAGRQRALDHFSESQAITRYSEVFGQAIARHHSLGC